MHSILLSHARLLHRLQHTFGLSGYVISWVRSYLANRTSFVKIDSSSSPNKTICTGVPQGSVIDNNFLFSILYRPVASVINPDLSNASNIVSFHQYADDTQLYIGTNLYTLADQVASIESCTQRVHNWLLNNGQHLNPSKSEAIAFSTQGPNLSNPWLNPLHQLQLPVHPSCFNHLSRIWVFILILECPPIGKFPKHARHLTSTFVHCATFDLPSPLRLVRR